MIIEYAEIHESRALFYFNLKDTFGFGKHKGRDINHIITHHTDYIEWLLINQTGFGLNTRAIAYYEVGPDGRGYIYPDHKIKLTETETISPPAKYHKPNKSITTFQPILGVNTMKRAILVSHNNKYQPEEDLLSDDTGNDFAYLTTIKDLEIGDYIVVDCQNGLQVCRVAKVIGLTPRQTNKAFKWVVTKVDLEQHEKNKLAQEKIQEIQNLVAKRKEQIEGQLILKQLAKEDPTMMGLLQELGELDSNLVPASILEAPKTVEETKVLD